MDSGRRHMSMLRQYTAADFFTIGNAACGTIAIFLCLDYLATDNRRFLWWVFFLLPLALVFDVLDGYVHGRGLVYAGLRPSAVALTDRGWVLSDFDLLRREGRVDPGETRLMLTASPHVPPDAFNGLVSPAWDVWSLGVVLNQALTGAPGRSGRRSKPNPAPPPFDSIIRGCLDPDPNERIRLRDVAGLLGTELHSSPWSKPEPPLRPESRSPQPKMERIPPASPAGGHPKDEVRRNGIAQSPAAQDAGHQSSGRRRSRIYSAPADKIPLRPRVVEVEEVRSFESPVNPRRRNWTFVAMGVLALGTGVLLAVIESREGRENATTGAEEFRTEAEQAQVAPPAPQKKLPEPPPPVDPAARKAAIVPFIIEWARTMRELNLDRHVDTYAPVVDVFFTKRSVPLSQVRAEKEQLFSGISNVRRLGVRNIRIESFQPERAVVTLRKDWDFRGSRATAGAERERLTLQWMDGRWRITGEQEIEIYWTKKPRPTQGD